MTKSKKPAESTKAAKTVKLAKKDRYNPWRVEKKPLMSKGASFLLGAAMLALFVEAFGLGWWLGGVLRQNVDHKAARMGQDSSGADLTTEPDENENVEVEVEGSSATEEKPDDNLAEKTETTQPIPEPDITGKKLIALTFDDGPSGAVTEQLLATLRQKQVRATFFVIGYMAERTPNQLQEQISEGHEVGSHTTNHTAFSRMSAAELANDTLRMNQIFTNILGHNTPFMRPPYGDGAYTEKARSNIGQPMILWTVDTLDWKYRDAGIVRQNAVKDAFDGAIILFHDVYQSTVDAIPMVIDDLRAQGYEFLTVSELAKARGVTMQNGAVYGSFTPH